ncbi:MAG: hypothetical protein SynsKO_12260 [Synoicihabitans sp.]
MTKVIAVILTCAFGAILPLSGETKIHDFGATVRGLSTVRLHPGAGANGESSLLMSAGQKATGIFVVDINLETGECRQFGANWDKANYVPSSYRSLSSGILYLGSGYSGHLHRYDPAQPERGLEDLGAIDPDLAIYPTGMDEAPDGTIWVGAYPGAALTKFDPKTDTFTRYGRLDPDDKYLYPLCGSDGTIAAQVKAITYRVVVFDRETGAFLRVGPKLDQPRLNPQKYHFYKGTDGLLYLDSYAGAFRIVGMEAIEISPADLPAVMPGIESTQKNVYQAMAPLPDGRLVSFADADTYGYREVRLHDPRGDRADKVITLDWQGAGSEIWTLHLGPDEKIYGSSMLPERLFRADLDGSNIIDFGQCSIANGEGYSMANYDDGKIAILSYPGTRLSLYDPALPYQFGTGPGSNPLDVGRLNDISTRPHVTLTAPDGKLWVGSAPDYGLYGGTLTWFDPKTALRKTYHNIMEDCTPFDLEWIPELDRLLIGFITESGTGAPVRVERGGFAIWDPRAEKADYLGDFGDEDLAGVCSLLPAGDGLVYAISGRNPRLLVHYDAKPAPTRLLLIDPVKQIVVDSAPIPESFGELPFESGNILRRDSDGQIYGATSETVFRIEPGTVEITPLHKITEGEATVIGPIHKGRLYFASLWRLRMLEL